MSPRATLRWVLCLLCCCGLSGCTPTETPADKQKNPHYQAGKERLSALDYKGAIDNYKKLIELNSVTNDAYFDSM